MANTLHYALVCLLVGRVEASPDKITNFELKKTYLRPKKECFTQGIYFEDDGSVLETCGLTGQSYIRRFNLNDDEKKYPEILDQQKVHHQIFLEGIAMLKDKFWTLTWQNNKILVHDRKKWGKAEKPEDTLPWTYGEGWGLTTDGCKFFANTGKDFILHLDEKGKEIKRVNVKLNGKPLLKMNDMVYITPKLWVNVWYTNMVYRIDPDSGEIEKVFDMSDQIPYAKNWDLPAGNTPNGLAYSFERDPNALFVTGKRWPSIFDLRFQGADLCGENMDGDKNICASAPRSPCWTGTNAVAEGKEAEATKTSTEKPKAEAPKKTKEEPKAEASTKEPKTEIVAKEGALEPGDGISEVETKVVHPTNTTTTTTPKKTTKKPALIPQLKENIAKAKQEKADAFRVCMIFVGIFAAMTVLALFFFCIGSWRQNYH